jgi:hypothetical protein
MRKQLLVAVAVVVLALVGSSGASAQGYLTRVSVPFQFVVGDTLLPAGAYVVANVGEGPGMLVIRSEDGKSVASVLANVGEKQSPITNAALSFRKIGGQHFLSTISTPDGRAQAIPLPKERVDAVLAKLNGTQPPRPGRPTVR